MAGVLTTIWDRVRGVGRPDDGDYPSDRNLLERFARGGDVTAFEELLARHGPVVLGVCRRVLNHTQDAEDAFQATWLALARRAAAVRDPASVGAWLHSVALHVALRAREARTRRAQRERGSAGPEAEAPPDPALQELRRLVDEELARLPSHLRGPLVLSHLEGKTQDEAARQLGCSLATFKRRLERGRTLLRARLVGRGAAPAVALVGATLAPGATQAGPAAALAGAVVKAAGLCAAGKPLPPGLVAPEVVDLADDASRMLARTHAKAVALLCLFLALVTAGGLAAATLGGDPAASPGDGDGRPGPLGGLAALFDRGRWARFASGGVFIGGYPAMSPDGKRIVYSSSRTGRGDLYCVNRDGTGKVRLTDDPDYEGDPTFSPDGKQIAFMRERGGIAHVWVMDADGKNPRQLTDGPAYDQSPSFSPAGARILFTRLVTDGKFRPGSAAAAETFVMNRDGTGQNRLTHNEDADFEPVFAPDGSEIVYHVGAKEVWRMGKAAADPRQLGAGSSPSFSPDGKLIVFLSDPFGREISVMNRDGTGRRVVLDAGAYVVRPSFTPDGRQILFLRMRSTGAGDICLVAPDGTGLTRIADTE